MKAVIWRNRVHKVVFGTHLMPDNILHPERKGRNNRLTTFQFVIGEDTFFIIAEATTYRFWKRLKRYVWKVNDEPLQTYVDNFEYQGELGNLFEGTY